MVARIYEKNTPLFMHEESVVSLGESGTIE